MTLPTIEQIRTIGVIGAGTMGYGIAHVAALMGAQVHLQVHLYDAMRGAAQAGLARSPRDSTRASSLANYSKRLATRRSHGSRRSTS